MALKLELLDREDRRGTIPIVLKSHIVDNENAIEPNRNFITLHDDVETVPVANLTIGNGKSLRGILLVVVKTARADAPLIVNVPDLHLRSAAEIKAGIARNRHDAPIGPKLEVLEILGRSERIAALVAVEEEVTVAHVPVLVALCVGLLLHFGALLGSSGLTNLGVVELLFGGDALPHRLKLLGATGEVRRKAGRRLLLLTGASLTHLGAGRKLLDADVLPHYAMAVAEPADVALLVVKAGVLAAVGRCAVGRHTREIGLCDKIAVQVDFDFLADNLDFSEVPHTRLAHVAAAGGEQLFLAANLLAAVVAAAGNDAVDRARVLIGFELVAPRSGVIILRAAVIEKLKLAHSVVGGIDIGRRSADAKAVVAVFGHQELETENEVLVLLDGKEIAEIALDLAIGLASENSLFLDRAVVELCLNNLNAVHLRTKPPRQILAVKQRNEAFFNRVGIFGTA